MINFLTEDEEDNLHYHAHYLSDISSDASEKFLEDWKRSPILALYMVENNYLHFEHMMECIILEAESKRTRYENNMKLDYALEDNSCGEHTIEINTSPYNNEDIYLENIQAYHISSNDLSLIKRFLKMEQKYGDKSEGSEYELKVYSNTKDIQLYHCYASPYISSNECIKGNRYSENCDTMGSQIGAKSQNNYIFYNTDSKEYVVIYHSYWCM